MARMGAATRLEDLTENQWDGQLFRGPKAVAVQLGWDSYHVLWSRGSRPGFPDRVCWRERVIYVETKTEKGKLSDAQTATLTALAAAGEECYVWRPGDLDEAGKVLAHRGPLTWRPRTLWPLQTDAQLAIEAA